MRYHNKNRKTKKTLYLVIALIILGIGAALFVVIDNKENPNPSTKTPPTAQSDFSGSEPRKEPAKTPDARVSATDNNGSDVGTIPSSSQWTTSKDGSSITVYSPSPNGKFSSGDAMYGAAKSNTVSYELEDNVSGVIAQGTANVVRGKFSVNFTFSTTATSGSINVFNQDSQGVISNIVTVPVSFK